MKLLNLLVITIIKSFKFSVRQANGTGKTSYLTRQINLAAKKLGSDNILVASFTKAAAVELVGRDLALKDGQVATLHAHAYRAIGRPDVLEKKTELIKEWNTRHPQYALSKSAIDIDDAVDAGTYDDTDGDGDVLLAKYQVMRARCSTVWLSPVIKDFAKCWENFKAETKTIDFTDMIALALDRIPYAPGNPTVMFIDEAQDMTPLEWRLCRQWGKNTEHLIVAGDDDQCQPAGNQIDTTLGTVDISLLDENKDLILSYDKSGGGSIYRTGYEFQKTSRHYNGFLYHFTVGSYNFSTTNNHYLMCRWSKRAVGAVGVYLMKRGNAYRVGTTEVIRNRSGLFGVGQRCRQENADAAWLLAIFDTDKEARLYEDKISIQYGISKMVFISPSKGFQLIYNQNELNEHHNNCIEFNKIEKLLFDFDLHRDYPYWLPDGRQRAITAWQKVRACNIISGYMDMMTKNKETFTANLEKLEWSGTVYSLNVAPYHTYISNNVIVFNCLYDFKGASANTFFDTDLPENHKHVLIQSHRVPQVVHKAANNWINLLSKRQPKDYKPRTDADGKPVEGALRWLYNANFNNTIVMIKDCEQYLCAGKSIMFLATCGYMLTGLQKELRAAGLPFHNPYKVKRGDWNPFGQRKGVASLLAYLAPSMRGWRVEDDLEGWRKLSDTRLWTLEEIYNWVGAMGVSTFLKRGAVKQLEEMTEAPTANEFAALLLHPSDLPKMVSGNLAWFLDHAAKSNKNKFEYFTNIVKKHQVGALKMTPPPITIGTIHSVKGGEADVVYLMPDLARRAYANWATVEGRDSVIRQFYVAFTRTREVLVICNPASEYYIKGLHKLLVEN